MPRTKKTTEEEPAERIKVRMLEPVMTKEETYNAQTEPEVPLTVAQEWIEAGVAEALD